jgi:hypothetical protein
MSVLGNPQPLTRKAEIPANHQARQQALDHHELDKYIRLELIIASKSHPHHPSKLK